MATIHLQTELPGPKSQAIVVRREAATPRGAAKLSPVAVVRAEGAALTDADGNTLLDFAGGIGALLSFLVAGLKGQLTWQSIKNAVIETLEDARKIRSGGVSA